MHVYTLLDIVAPDPKKLSAKYPTSNQLKGVEAYASYQWAHLHWHYDVSRNAHISTQWSCLFVCLLYGSNCLHSPRLSQNTSKIPSSLLYFQGQEKKSKEQETKKSPVHYFFVPPKQWLSIVPSKKLDFFSADLSAQKSISKQVCQIEFVIILAIDLSMDIGQQKVFFFVCVLHGCAWVIVDLA